MTKTITLADFQQGMLALPVEDVPGAGRPAPVPAQIAATREVRASGNDVLDLRAFVQVGSTLSWNGPDLVVQSPQGEVLLVRDAIAALTNGGLVVLLELVPNQPMQMVLTQHEGQPVLLRSYLTAPTQDLVRTTELIAAPAVRISEPYRAPQLESNSRTFTDDVPVFHQRLLETAVTQGILQTAQAVQHHRILNTVQTPAESGVLMSALQNNKVATDRLDAMVALPPGIPIDLPPVVGLDDLAATKNQGPFTLNVLSNDRDPEFAADGSVGLVLSAAQASHGLVTFSATGVVSYTPAAHYFGTDVIIYRVTDRTGQSAQGQVRVLVAGVNDPPVVAPAWVVTEGRTHVLTASVLGVSDVDTPAQEVYVALRQWAGFTLRIDGVVVTAPVAEFTLADLNRGAVVLTHDGTNVAPLAGPLGLQVRATDDSSLATWGDWHDVFAASAPYFVNVNDAPVLTADFDALSAGVQLAASVLEGANLDVGHALSVSDEEGDLPLRWLLDLSGLMDAGQEGVEVDGTMVYAAQALPGSSVTTVHGHVLRFDPTTGLLEVTLAGPSATVPDMAYRHEGDNPTTGHRYLKVAVANADMSAWQTLEIQLTPVNDAPWLQANATAAIGQAVDVVFAADAVQIQVFEELVLTEPEGDALASARLVWQHVGQVGEAFVIGGASHAYNSTDSVTTARGDTFRFDGGKGIDVLFAPGTTAAQAQQVLRDLVYEHNNRPPFMDERTFSLTVTDEHGGTTVQALQVTLKPEPDLVVTQANLEISHVDASGNVVSDLDWQSGGLLRVRWFDKPSADYVGDGNSTRLGATPVTAKLDLSQLGQGVKDMTETVAGSGVWEYTFDTSSTSSSVLALLADPGALLSQVKVMAVATATSVDTGLPTQYESLAVSVNRILLGAVDNGLVLGTSEDDVFVLTNAAVMSALEFSHVIEGGEGFDELDLSAITGDMFLDIAASRVSLTSATGLDTLYQGVEQIRVSLHAASLQHVQLALPPSALSWSESGGNAVVSVDMDGNGSMDLRVLFADQSESAAKLLITWV